jgi:hypothetical protein
LHDTAGLEKRINRCSLHIALTNESNKGTEEWQGACHKGGDTDIGRPAAAGTAAAAAAAAAAVSTCKPETVAPPCTTLLASISLFMSLQVHSTSTIQPKNAFLHLE